MLHSYYRLVPVTPGSAIRTRRLFLNLSKSLRSLPEHIAPCSLNSYFVRCANPCRTLANLTAENRGPREVTKTCRSGKCNCRLRPDQERQYHRTNPMPSLLRLMQYTAFDGGAAARMPPATRRETCPGALLHVSPTGTLPCLLKHKSNRSSTSARTALSPLAGVRFCSFAFRFKISRSRMSLDLNSASNTGAER